MKHSGKKHPIFYFSVIDEMKTIYLNNYMKERFDKMRLNYNQKCKTRFLKRKYSHVNSENINKFYAGLNITIDDKLFEIRYHSAFTFYLYLYLKSNAAGYQKESPAEFLVSMPLNVNFNLITKLAGISRNTVKAAFKELIQLGFVYFDDDIPLSKNKVKQCLLLNSKYLLGYDENEHKIIYSHCSIDNGF